MQFDPQAVHAYGSLRLIDQAAQVTRAQGCCIRLATQEDSATLEVHFSCGLRLQLVHMRSHMGPPLAHLASTQLQAT